MKLKTELRTAFDHTRWAFAITRNTCPRLFALYGANAAILIFLPACVALSVRGLVNSVDQAIAGVSLADTNAWFWLFFGLAAALAGSAGAAANRYFNQRLQVELAKRLHSDILKHHESVSFSRIEKQSYRNQMRRAQKQPEVAVANLYAFTLELATKIFQVLSLAVILFAIEPLLLALLIPLGIPFLFFQMRLSQKQFAELDKRVHKMRWMEYYSGLLNDENQAGEIRLLGLGPLIIQRWGRIMDEFRALRLDYFRLDFLGYLAFALLSIAAVYFSLAHAMTNIVGGQSTIGDLAIFLSAAAQLRSLIENGMVLAAAIRWQILNVEQLRGFFHIEDHRKTKGRLPVGRVEGKIEFRNVGFRYQDDADFSLKDVSFVLEPGENVALVGANGAGKSTVAKLIAGLYEAQEGVVLADDRDIRELDTEQWQRLVGCIFQHFGCYAATAADNIAFGDWKKLLDEEAAIEAIARKAKVHDMVKAMPNGYQTLLGRAFGDYQPSGGQWQQLAIARLIAQDARILILDEPTANLDVAAEAALFDEFIELSTGRTTVLISHRFSTVSMADRILFLEKGRLVESGSHKDLMALNGRYAGLYRLANRFRED
jgi:ATP-binding cassette subfamily B protein